MSAISALKSRHRRQALAAQKAAEPALHIIQHAHCAEPSEICPDCGNEVLVNKPSGAAFCIVCDYQRPGKLRHC